MRGNDRKMKLALMNKDGTEIVLEDLKICSDFKTRLLGLMGIRDLGLEKGLLIEPCNSIHTCFMRFNIDVAFLDRKNKVLHIVYGMKPWKITRIIKAASKVVEAKEGVLRGKITIGDTVVLQENE